MIETSSRHRQIAVACIFTISTIAAWPRASAQNASAPPAAAAQVPALAYDVMTVKINKTASNSVDVDSNDDRFSATNVPLRMLLGNIYDIRQDLISGMPGPVDSARFDIEAKVSDPDPAAIKKMSRDQHRQMLLPLLTERFELKTHIETKTLPVYELVLIHGGPKFKPSADQTKTGGGDMSIHGNNNRSNLSARDVPMTGLAKAQTDQVHRTVIDKTGLKGHFDFALQWSNDENPYSGAEQSPSIFTAVQEQLGLKLQPAKGPVETLVVDHAVLPSDN